LLSELTPLDGTHTATTSYTYNSFGEVLTMTDDERVRHAWEPRFRHFARAE